MSGIPGKADQMTDGYMVMQIVVCTASLCD